MDRDSLRFMGVPGGIPDRYLSPQHPVNNESDVMNVAANMAVKAGRLQPGEELTALDLSEREQFIKRAANLIGYGEPSPLDDTSEYEELLVADEDEGEDLDEEDEDEDDGSSGRLPGWIGNYPIH